MQLVKEELKISMNKNGQINVFLLKLKIEFFVYNCSIIIIIYYIIDISEKSQYRYW